MCDLNAMIRTCKSWKSQLDRDLLWGKGGKVGARRKARAGVLHLTPVIIIKTGLEVSALLAEEDSEQRRLWIMQHDGKLLVYQLEGHGVVRRVAQYNVSWKHKVGAILTRNILNHLIRGGTFDPTMWECYQSAYYCAWATHGLFAAIHKKTLKLCCVLHLPFAWISGIYIDDGAHRAFACQKTHMEARVTVVDLTRGKEFCVISSLGGYEPHSCFAQGLVVVVALQPGWQHQHLGACLGVFRMPETGGELTLQQMERKLPHSAQKLHFVPGLGLVAIGMSTLVLFSWPELEVVHSAPLTSGNPEPICFGDTILVPPDLYRVSLASGFARMYDFPLPRGGISGDGFACENYCAFRTATSDVYDAWTVTQNGRKLCGISLPEGSHDLYTLISLAGAPSFLATASRSVIRVWDFDEDRSPSQWGAIDYAYQPKEMNKPGTEYPGTQYEFDHLYVKECFQSTVQSVVTTLAIANITTN